MLPFVPTARVWLALGLAAAVAAQGCAPSSSASSGSSSSSSAFIDAGSEMRAPIELITWWPRGAASDTVAALIKAHRARFPDDDVITATATLSGEARATLRERMRRGEPPDVFQANAGRDLMQWVLVNGDDDSQSKVLALDDVEPDVATWRKTMPAAVLDAVSYQGRLYGVPSDIHQVNGLFLNRRIFTKYGLSPPRTLEDLHHIAKVLEGTGIRPIAMGTKDPWTLSLLVFECLLVAREGPAFYETYFRGRGVATDPRVRETLKAALDLFGLLNDDRSSLTWLQAIEIVARGDAAMTVTGDWGRSAFTARGWKAGADYDMISFPGTSNAFVYTSDALAIPVRAKNRAGGLRLLETIGSRDGQALMNGTKDAFSARLDVPPPPGREHEDKRSLVASGAGVLAISGLVPSRFEADLGAALAEMDQQHDIEPVIHMLRTRYVLLR